MIHDVHDGLMSHRVRQGRENCCHDIAMAVRNDRTTCAGPLVVIDALRGSLSPGIMPLLMFLAMFGCLWWSGAATNAADVKPPAIVGFTGSLRGRVVFNGTPPVRKKLAVNKDHEALEGKELFDESLIIGEDGGVANVFVWLRDADVPVAPIGAQPPPATLRIRHLRYEPHALAMTTSQKLVLVNEDPVGTSPIFSAQTNPPSNLLVPIGSTSEHQFHKAERLPFPVAASVHPWLKAVLLVRDNPYFAITSENGRFEIKNLPPGEWTFQFWHEKAGYLKRQTGWPKGRLGVTIGGGEKDLGKIDVKYEDFDLPRAETAEGRHVIGVESSFKRERKASGKSAVAIRN